MAASSLLTLIDDIATILDDVAVLTKVATKKTAGVLGDDLALNAQQVSGVKADRELPVVWAVAKGSLINKAILVPLALAISAFLPWLVTPLLMIGGAFLCYEGFEKVMHKLFHKKEEAAHHVEHLKAVADESVDLVTMEKDKVKGAIRTDFILSAEIIVIALGTLTDKPFGTQLAVLVSIALLMTVGVYGLVAAIVKLDDLGLYLSQRGRGLLPVIGRGILVFAPWLMKALAFAGTIAMFLVGGSIVLHGLPALHHWAQGLVAQMGEAIQWLGTMLADGLAGVVVGALVLALVTLVKRFMPQRAARQG